MCQSLRILLSLLFSIGYSATPGNNATNELYRLNSYEASRMNLVKKIDVLGFQEEQIADGVMPPSFITNKRHTEQVHRTASFDSNDFSTES